MRLKTELFTIDGNPLPTPDRDVTVTYQDLEGPESGRDENGLLRRQVLRRNLAVWSLCYCLLEEEDRAYLERLMSQGDTFQFGHPSREDAATQAVSECYRHKTTAQWHSAASGLWKDYTLEIREV